MEIEDLDREQLLTLLKAYSKVVMGVDGYWFMAVEEKHNHDAAYEMDCAVWAKAAPYEAKLVSRALEVGRNLDIPTMMDVLRICPTWHALGTKSEVLAPNQGLLTVDDCFVQKNRARMGLEEFACKDIGLLITNAYGKALNPEVKVTCKVCPPDPHPPDIWCQWLFEL